MCVRVCVFFPYILDIKLDVPAGVTQEEGHTGFLIHLLSAVRALIFLARRIQPFVSLVDRGEKSRLPGSNSRPNVSEGYEVPLSYRGDLTYPGLGD